MSMSLFYTKQTKTCVTYNKNEEIMQKKIRIHINLIEHAKLGAHIQQQQKSCE